MHLLSAFRNPKKLGIIPFAFLFLLCGCSKYQYVTMSSSIPKDDDKKFVLSNDTLTVKYNFLGRNCPITIELHNGQSRPLYVDWSKSAVIIDGERFSYWADEARINAAVSTLGIRWNDEFTSSVGTISGTISKSERVSFIPPQSYISATPLWLKNSFFNLKNEQNHTRVNLYTTDGVVKANRYSFEVLESPLAFRSFLTVSFSEDFSNPVYLDHTFWVSDIIESAVGPQRLPHRKSDQFYIEKTSSSGVLIGTTAVVGALLVLPVVIISNSPLADPSF